MRLSRFLPDALLLELAEKRITKLDQKRVKSIQSAIEEIQERWPQLANIEPEVLNESPIFIFSAGWRAGSTLLQRLVMSNNKTLIWGEPFRLCNIINHQSESLSALGIKYPQHNLFYEHQKLRSTNNLLDSNIATLYPEIKYLRKAHQDFFLALYKQPAVDAGYTHWGFKEVRLDFEKALYLKWLFPSAKFLFLYRNPYKAYASLKPNLTKWSLYETWPKTSVRTPYKFGKYWKDLVTGYLENSDKVAGLVIKYEELCNGKLPLDKLENYLGIDISRDLLEKKVGSTTNKLPVSRIETFLIKKAVNPLAEELGSQTS